MSDIQSAYLGTTRTENISVRTVTNDDVQYSASVLERRNRIPVVYVFGEIAPGSSENAATDNVRRQVMHLPVSEGVEVEMGGANAESADANQAIFLALPFGLFIILMSLMFEFNSFRRGRIILFNVSLWSLGSVPWLILFAI